MAKQRLSQLQKEILLYLMNRKDNAAYYKLTCRDTAKKLDKMICRGRIIDNAFSVSFHRSVVNLCQKELLSKSYNKNFEKELLKIDYPKRVNKIWITKKGQQKINELLNVK